MAYKTELQFVIVKGGSAYTILRVEACSKVVYILSFLNSIQYTEILSTVKALVQVLASGSANRVYLRWHDKTTRLNQQPHALNSVVACLQ